MSWIATGGTYARRGLVATALAAAAAGSLAWLYFLGLELFRGIAWTIGAS